jgi:hypothetical protein
MSATSHPIALMCLTGFLFSWFTNNSVVPSVLLFLFFTFLKHKTDFLTVDLALYALHLVTSCHWVSISAQGAEERIAWMISTCQGWILGLNYNCNGMAFSALGKGITIVWLNFFCGCDMISPNFICLVPIIVSRMKKKEDANEEKETEGIIISNTHVPAKVNGISLPLLAKFVPIGNSPTVASLFYLSNSGKYLFRNEEYKVISLINGRKALISITKAAE